MPNLLLTIRYDGTRYHGWQVQKNAITIQEELQNAIEKPRYRNEKGLPRRIREDQICL